MGIFSFFDLPLEYNRSIHGPYDPARYYGKPDTPFSELKLCEIPSWLKRRSFTPRAIYETFIRAYWRWDHRWIQPKRTGCAFIYHQCIAIMFVYYVLKHKDLWAEVHYKYH